MKSRKFKASERLALSFVERVITTSATTARLLSQHYAVPPDKISVVLPGNDRVPLPQRPAGDVVNLLAVGSIVPRKGYDLLIAALGKIPDLTWRLVIAADPSRSPETARALEAQIASLRLTDRVELAGVVSDERLAELYANADLFVLPSRYEGYGMAYTEAIAHGVPVIGTTAGAIPEAVPAGAGMLVAPDNRRRAHLGVDAAGRASRRARAPHRRRPRRGRDLADLGRRRAAVRASAGSGAHERLLLRMADAARALRSRGPQRDRARRDAGGVSRTGVDRGGRSRLRHRLDLPGDREAPAGAADLAAGRQRSRPARQCSGARPAAGGHRRGEGGRSGARSRAGARRPGRPDHDLGAARSRVGGLARTADGRSGGAAAAGLCGAQLRRPRVVRSGGAARCRHRRGGEPASARQQGIWPRARPGRGRERARSSPSASAIRSSKGSSDWTFGATDQAIQREVLRGFADAAGELRELPSAHIADWLARRLELVAAGASSMRVGHVDFFAMPMPIR